MIYERVSGARWLTSHQEGARLLVLSPRTPTIIF